MKRKILKVTQIKAYSLELKQLNKFWKRYAMQMIKTNDGTFIDHKVDEKIGYWRGVDYEVSLGKEYEFSQIVDNENNQWNDNSSTIEGNHPWMKPL